MADVSVRPARADDADAVARVQLSTWRTAYAGVLPAPALALPEAEVAQAWRAATGSTSPAQQLLVALDGAQVVGLLACEPGGDGAVEVTALLVEPRWGRRGHGSRLLAAAVDGWREAGLGTALDWVFEDDRATRSFLESAGWEPDGAARGLDTGEAVVRQVRYHVAVGAP